MSLHCLRWKCPALLLPQLVSSAATLGFVHSKASPYTANFLINFLFHQYFNTGNYAFSRMGICLVSLNPASWWHVVFLQAGQPEGQGWGHRRRLCPEEGGSSNSSSLQMQDWSLRGAAGSAGSHNHPKVLGVRSQISCRCGVKLWGALEPPHGTPCSWGYQHHTNLPPKNS